MSLVDINHDGTVDAREFNAFFGFASQVPPKAALPTQPKNPAELLC
jgi:hypothetical protein